MKRNLIVLLLGTLMNLLCWTGASAQVIDTVGAPCPDCWRVVDTTATSIHYHQADGQEVHWQLINNPSTIWVVGEAWAILRDSSGSPMDTVYFGGRRTYCQNFTLTIDYFISSSSIALRWDTDGIVDLVNYMSTGLYPCIWSSSIVIEEITTSLISIDTCCAIEVAVGLEDSALFFCYEGFTLWQGGNCPTTSLANGAGSDITIYPNPTQGLVRLDGVPVDTLTTITDCFGRLVWSGISSTIDLAGQPAGLYYLRVATPEGMTTIKVVKE